MIALFKQHPKILCFGLLQVFFTAPGQTFLISLFVGAMFSSLALPISTFAGLYSLATISASFLLNPAGRLIDRFSPKIILCSASSLMALGCFILAFAQSVVMIFIGFFLLRLIGQGVFVLISSTLINRHFHKNRGKAHSMASLGYPLSEMIYPVLALFLLTHFGWRISYLIFAFSTLVIMLPLQFYLLHHARLKKGHFFPGEILIQAQRLPGMTQDTNAANTRSLKLAAVLKDPFFYPILLASAMPPLVVSGLFFHQESLFQAQLWSLKWATLGLSFYAVIKAFFSLGIGAYVDKKGPLGPFFVIIFLIAVATGVAAFGGPAFISIPFYYSCLGASLGMSAVVMNIIWVKLYGVQHIGSIKGFIGTFRNGFTGLAPFPIALALEKGFAIDTIFYGHALLVVILAVIPILLSRFDSRF